MPERFSGRFTVIDIHCTRHIDTRCQHFADVEHKNKTVCFDVKEKGECSKKKMIEQNKQVVSSGLEKMAARPPSGVGVCRQSHCKTGIDPRHSLHHLSLLPSGSDEVRDRLLRGVQSKWSKGSKYKILGREFSPA